MDALEAAGLARDMVSSTGAQALASRFLQAALRAHALHQGLCYRRDAAEDRLSPVACAALRMDALWPIGMDELENPLVFSLMGGKPCHVDPLGSLVDVGAGFDDLREQLSGRDAMLVLPLRTAGRQPLGVLVMVGEAAALRAWRDDPLWQMMTEVHEHLFARLHEPAGMAADALTAHAVRATEAAERGRARAARLLAAEFVGSSAMAQRLREDMLRLADSTLATLITGETGAGKDHAAWLIHQVSSRRGKFVPVNCAAIPKDLIEAELFGSVRGAFTGATQARSGLVAEADGGTLFLDEIGDMPLALQGTLLRLLNEKKYRPVGATREQASDFRLICATHQPLPQLIRDGRFREDLYFRIRQHTLHLPPLRERAEDVGLLAAHVLLQHNRERQAHVAGIEPQALALLQAHPFPGNVRELRSLVLAAAERTAQGASISAAAVRELQADLAAPVPGGSAEDAALLGLLRTDNLPGAVEAFERLVVGTRLRQTDGSRSLAARSLGIPKRTLARKCQTWNLDRENVSL